MEEKLNELSILNAAIVGILFGLAYYFMFYQASDPQTLLEGINQQTVTAQGELAKFDREIKEGQKTLDDIEAIRIKAEKAYKYIPEEFSTEEASSTISEEARLAGLSIQSISKSARWSNRENVSSADIDARVQGSFEQIMVFLSELTRKDRIYNVTSLSINEARNNGPKKELVLSAKIEFFKRYEKPKKKGS